jgi:hypothetical protein
MKQLEELEIKVLQIIEKNKELESRNDLLIKENEQLIAKCSQMEGSLMNKDRSSKDLENEKLVIKNSIKELLDSISSLEERNKEVIK